MFREHHDLWKRADGKTRLVVTFLGSLTVVFVAFLSAPEALIALPPWARLPMALAVIGYGLAAVGLLFLAVRALRPAPIPSGPFDGARPVESGPEGDPEAAQGLRSFEDILRRDVASYQRAWKTARLSQLRAEMAEQAHALAGVCARELRVVDRLYRGLQALTAMAVVLTAAGAVMLLAGPHARVRLPHGLRVEVGRAEPPPPAAGGHPRRDWSRFPAVVERTTGAEIVALGDVHGGYDRLVRLLAADHLIRPQPGSPGGYVWSGGPRTLVSVGDLIDKGPQSLEVMDLMMGLERDAPRSGGEVIVTLGNHEAEFLANPGKKKAREFEEELLARHLDPRNVASGTEPYGDWLMERPIAARVNSWFFAHAGRTGGATLAELADRYRAVVDAGQWSSIFLVGDGSILEARQWWRAEDPGRDLHALSARHIVFGHDPSAFHDKGHIEAAKGGKLVLIDVGMSPAIDYSRGELMLIDRVGPVEVATAVDATGARREVWRGPAAPAT